MALAALAASSASIALIVAGVWVIIGAGAGLWPTLQIVGGVALVLGGGMAFRTFTGAVRTIGAISKKIGAVQRGEETLF